MLEGNIAGIRKEIEKGKKKNEKRSNRRNRDKKFVIDH